MGTRDRPRRQKRRPKTAGRLGRKPTYDGLTRAVARLYAAYSGRSDRCRACDVLLVDAEPMAGHPHYRHPEGGCRHAGRLMRRGDYKSDLRKGQRRARDRGARLAARHRPRLGS